MVAFLDKSLLKPSLPVKSPPKVPNLRKPKPRFWEDSEDTALLQQLRKGRHKYDIRIEGKNPAEISERIRVHERAKAYVRTPRVSTTHSTLNDVKVYPGPNYSLPDIPPVYSVPLPEQLEATLHRANKTCIKCEGDLYSSAHCKTCHEEFDNQWTQEVFDHWKTKNQSEHGILPDRGDDFISHLAGRFQKLPGERFIDAIGGTGHACWAARSMGYQEIVYNDPDDSSSALVTQLSGGEKTRKDLFTLVNKLQHRHSFGPNSRDSIETKAAKRYLRIRGSGGVWAGDFTNSNAIQLYEHLDVHSENVYNFLASILDDKHEKNLFLINLLRLPPGVFSQVATCVRKMDRCILIVPDSISHVQTFNFLPHQYYFTHKGYLVFSRIELNPLAGMLEITQE